MSFRPVGAPLVLALSMVSAGLISTCAHRSVSECRSDFDCKLERVCDSGACVWPSRTGSPPPTAPAATDEEGASAGEGTPTQPPPVLSDAQAMFRQDPMHRGRSRFRMPIKRPEIRWTYESRGPISFLPGGQQGRLGGGGQPGRQGPPDRPGRKVPVGLPHHRHGVRIAGHRHKRRHLRRLGRRSPVRPGSQGAQGAVALPAGRLSGRAARAGQQPLRRRRRTHHRSRRDAVPGRRRRVCPEPRRQPEMAVRHRRPRGDGAQHSARRDHRRRQPGQPDLRDQARRDEALGLPGRRRRRVHPGHRRRRHHLRGVGRPEAVRAGARRRPALGVQRRRETSGQRRRWAWTGRFMSGVSMV